MTPRMTNPALLLPEALEAALASLLVTIGLINFFNRINVATRQVAGSVPVPVPA